MKIQAGSIDDYILSLPKSVVFNIMWEAVNCMQMYNGKSVHEAVYEAIDAVNNDDGTYTVPSKKALREVFEDKML